MTRDWMSVPEAAERLGLGVNAVYALLASRKLGCRRVGPSGGRYQITEAHVAAYLASCEQGPAPEKPKAAPAPKGGFGRRGKGERLDGKPPRYLKNLA